MLSEAVIKLCATAKSCTVYSRSYTTGNKCNTCLSCCRIVPVQYIGTLKNMATVEFNGSVVCSNQVKTQYEYYYYPF